MSHGTPRPRHACSDTPDSSGGLPEFDRDTEVERERAAWSQARALIDALLADPEVSWLTGFGSNRQGLLLAYLEATVLSGAAPSSSDALAAVRVTLGVPSRRPVRPEDRALVLSLGSCAYCGSPDGLVVDHVIPVALGGSNLLPNLQPLCAPCNSAKGDSL